MYLKTPVAMMKIFAMIFYLFIQQQNFAQQSKGYNTTLAQPVLMEEFPVNTAQSERDFALSPDGREIFYTLQSPGRNFLTILYMQKDTNGVWSTPVVAPFAGRYSDMEPAFTIDGKKLFFVSNRPLAGDKVKDFDIWFVEKTGSQWREPRNIGAPINTPANEYYPSLSKSGTLYFTAAYKKGVGQEDIYVSSLEQGEYQAPEPLDTAINSTGFEFNAFISPHEDFIIFSATGRQDEKGRGDLYMSIKDPGGKWKPAKNLTLINSDRLDYCPFVSFDKKKLFFTSERHLLKDHFDDEPASYSDLIRSYTSVLNGGGNIYWIEFEWLVRQME